MSKERMVGILSNTTQTKQKSHNTRKKVFVNYYLRGLLYGCFWSCIRTPHLTFRGQINSLQCLRYHPVMSTHALLLVDVQPEWYAVTNAPPTPIQRAFPRFPQRIRTLLNTHRRLGSRIIHIRSRYATDNHDKSQKSDTRDTSDTTRKWHAQFRQFHPHKTLMLSGDAHPCARALPGEDILYKPTFDGFLYTPLDRLLAQYKVRTVSVAGLLTSVCVHHTAHGAFVRGYRPSVVCDACADLTRERHVECVRLYGGYIWGVE